MKKYALSLVAAIFLLIGLTFLAADVFVWKNTTDFIARAKKASGTVVKLVEHISEDSDHNTSISYRPQVKFTTEPGTTFTFQSSSGSNPPSYKEGETVKVLYDPNNPYDAQIDSYFDLWLGFFIFGFLGGVLTIIGIIIVIATINHAKQVDWLKKYGRAIMTDFTSVGKNTSIRVNGEHPFVIISQILEPKDNKVRTFRSDNIWYDPTKFVQPGQKIKVLIDPKKPNSYYMDISFLPKA